MTHHTVALTGGHLFNRVVSPSWDDPFDTSYARRDGGRWNPPGQFDTLYLNDDLPTARRQIERLLENSAVEPHDLTDHAYELVGCHLPNDQQMLDVTTPEGVEAVGLPLSYPTTDNGQRVPHQVCQPIGTNAYGNGLDVVCCRSAATLEGGGRETVWWPRGQHADQVGVRVPYGQWRDERVVSITNLIE